MLVCFKLFIFLKVRSKDKQVDCDTMTGQKPISVPKRAGRKPKTSPPHNIHQYWSLTKNVLYFAGLVDFVLVCRVATPRISAESLYRPIPVGSMHNEELFVRSELTVSLCKEIKITVFWTCIRDGASCRYGELH